ncbi:putative E3 ubiquitin-protein ligase [Basidiobolus ranarum]|uniref:E3 ubiquitin-protein ligase n=1 Tax=Basidiobolus ranarum TaxID=34480 RepID=A0ABR2VPR9_9FUNG
MPINNGSHPTDGTTIIIPVTFHSPSIGQSYLDSDIGLTNSANNSHILRQLLQRYSNLLLLPHHQRREGMGVLSNTLPASKQVMTKLATVSITSSHLSSQPSCSICHDEFACEGGLKSKVREMPCHHIFHEHCLFPWLAKCNTCPMCRSQIEAEPSAPLRTYQLLQVGNTDHSGACGHCHNSLNGECEEEQTSSATITLIGCKHIFHTSCLCKVALKERGIPLSQHSYVRCPTCQMEHLIKSSLLLPS